MVDFDDSPRKRYRCIEANCVGNRWIVWIPEMPKERPECLFCHKLCELFLMKDENI